MASFYPLPVKILPSSHVPWTDNIRTHHAHCNLLHVPLFPVSLHGQNVTSFPSTHSLHVMRGHVHRLLIGPDLVIFFSPPVSSLTSLCFLHGTDPIASV